MDWQRIFKNSIYVLIGVLASRVLYFVATVVLARTFSVDEFGKISFAYSLVLFFSILAHGSLDSIGSREVARTPDRVRLVGEIVAARLLNAVAAYVLLTVITFVAPFEPKIKILVLLEGLSFLLAAFSLSWFFEGSQRMELGALSRLVTDASFFVLVTLIVTRLPLLFSVPVIRACATCAGVIVALGVYTKLHGRLRFGFNRAWYTARMKEAVGLAAGLVLITAYNYSDRIILGILKSQREVGLYSLAYSIASAPGVLAVALTTAFFPVFSATWISDRSRIVVLSDTLTRLLSISGVLTGMLGVVVARSAILYTGGPAYLPATLTLQILMVNVPFLFVTASYHSPLIPVDKFKGWFAAVVAGGVSNLVLNVLLIPSWGMEGAAISTVISTVIVLGVAYGSFRKIAPVSIAGAAGKPLLAGLPAAAVLGFVLKDSTTSWALVTLAAVVMIVYGTVLVLTKTVTRKDLVLLTGFVSRASRGMESR